MQGVPVIGCTGGIGRGVHNHGTGTGGNSLADSRLVRPVHLLLVGFNLYQGAAGQFNLVLVVGKIRTEDNHLIPGIQQAQQGLGHAHAAGGGHQHFIGADVLLEIFLPCLTDGFDQFRVTFGVAVMSVTVAGIVISGINNAAIRGKVRVADAQIDHVIVAVQGFCVQGQACTAVLKTFGNVLLHFRSAPSFT